MSIAITDDHRTLADTAGDLLRKRDARGAARALLEAPDEPRPDLWNDVAGIGWLGLHVGEEHGGSGAGMEELVVVVEELGRALAAAVGAAEGRLDRLALSFVHDIR
jgi:alkylation response protein AidB-like acyl-CoA dehydrogenase